MSFMFLPGHLLPEFPGDGVSATHLLLEDGVGLVVVGGSGLAAGLPRCHFPEFAGVVEAGDSDRSQVIRVCHSSLC